jgi:hypothetical protein
MFVIIMIIYNCIAVLVAPRVDRPAHICVALEVREPSDFTFTVIWNIFLEHFGICFEKSDPPEYLSVLPLSDGTNVYTVTSMGEEKSLAKSRACALMLDGSEV